MARDLRRHGARHGDEAVRITTAASSRDSDIAARQRRYVTSMAIRTVCFVAAVAVGPGVLRWVLVAAALLLPYVAVVMANAVTTKDDGFDLPDRGYVHELGEGSSSRDEPPAATLVARIGHTLDFTRTADRIQQRAGSPPSQLVVVPDGFPVAVWHHSISGGLIA